MNVNVSRLISSHFKFLKKFAILQIKIEIKWTKIFIKKKTLIFHYTKINKKHRHKILFQMLESIKQN